MTPVQAASMPAMAGSLLSSPQGRGNRRCKHTPALPEVLRGARVSSQQREKPRPSPFLVGKNQAWAVSSRLTPLKPVLCAGVRS